MSRRRDKYIQFLKSNIWREIRKRVIQRDKNKCTRCGNRKDLQVHHLRYGKNIETVPLKYLQTVCKNCHKAIHRKQNKEKRKKRFKRLSFIVKLLYRSSSDFKELMSEKSLLAKFDSD